MDSTTRVQKKFQDRWAWLAALPSVNFKLLYLCVLDALTFFATWLLLAWLIFGSVKPETLSILSPTLITIVGAWYTFLGGLHGINLIAYWKKRSSSLDANADEDKGAPQQRAADNGAPDAAALPPAPAVEHSATNAIVNRAGPRPSLTDHDDGVL